MTTQATKIVGREKELYIFYCLLCELLEWLILFWNLFEEEKKTKNQIMQQTGESTRKIVKVKSFNVFNNII